MFKEIFGNCPQVKVIDYMISTPFSQHTKQQIAVGAEISRSTLNNFIDELVDIEILTCKNSKFSRKTGLKYTRQIFHSSS